MGVTQEHSPGQVSKRTLVLQPQGGEGCRGCGQPVLPYACGPAEAGYTEGRGYTHLGPPGTVLAAGQAWERQKQKTRFASRGRVPGRASGGAMVLGGSGAARRLLLTRFQESHCWLARSSRKPKHTARQVPPGHWPPHPEATQP